MAKTEQWNQPQYTEAFKGWRTGQADSAELDFLDAQASPRHLKELHAAKYSLLKKLGPAVKEYRFSDEAIHSVRQERGVYLSDPSIPKYQLSLATVIRSFPGQTRFARIYNARLSFQEVVRHTQMNEGSMDALFRDNNELIFGPSYDTEQRIDILYNNRSKAPSGIVLHRFEPSEHYPEGRTEDFAPHIRVADYITLGHLIQHDLNA